ncbi:unnamed protein product, partial [Oppiella nova]
LRYHERSHLNPKTYSCVWPGCDYKTRDRNGLPLHNRIHTKTTLTKPLPLRYKPQKESMNDTNDDTPDATSEDTSGVPMDQITLRKRIREQFQRGVPAGQAFKIVKTLYGSIISRSTLHKWYQRFKSGNLSVEDDSRSGRPKQTDLRVANKEGNLVFRCEWPDCGSEYLRKDRLQRHMMVHMNVKPYRCEWPGCDYASIEKYQLELHKTIHTGIKKYVCHWPECDRKFARPDHLRLHTLWHNNDKKYRCPWPGCPYRTCF